MKNFTLKIFLALAAIVTYSYTANAQVILSNRSKTPALVNVNKEISGLSVYTLISSDDTLSQNPAGPNFFKFGGSADGMGILKNNDNTYTMVVNHEDNFSVSRITLNSSFAPVHGEYLMNSDAGRWRLCSGTLATPAEHGFGPLYFTCGESSVESNTHAINPKSTTLFNTSNNATLAAGLGKWNAENAVPLSSAAYQGKTIILIGDDDSGNEGGQVAMYLSNTVGDLVNGNLYVLRRKNLRSNELDMTDDGTAYGVEFVQINNHTTLTGAQINTAAVTLNAIEFGRVEDIDYRKGSASYNREIYFTATGQATNGANADSSRTKWGRVYRLILNANNPLEGTLECILNGDDKSANNQAREFMNPDNICVTQDYVYVEEDPNGYGDSYSSRYENHDARIYQYDIQSDVLKVAMELDHRRRAVDSVKYNNNGNGGSLPANYAKSGFGKWEYGTMLDVSDLINVPNTFAICLQPHTWIGPDYQNPDKGTVRTTEKQASMIVLVQGLARKSTTTGIRKSDAEINILNVYPNPSSGIYEVNFNYEFSKSLKLQLTDEMGKVYMTQEIKNFNGSYSQPLDLSHLNNGTYILSFTAGENTFSKKLLKQ